VKLIWTAHFGNSTAAFIYDLSIWHDKPFVRGAEDCFARAPGWALRSPDGVFAADE